MALEALLKIRNLEIKKMKTEYEKEFRKKFDPNNVDALWENL